MATSYPSKRADGYSLDRRRPIERSPELFQKIGKKEIRKPGFSGKFESNFFLVTRKTSGLNTWSWGLLFELIDLFTFTAFFLLYHTGEPFLSFGEASSFENAIIIFKTFQKLFDRGLHFLYTIC